MRRSPLLLFVAATPAMILFAPPALAGNPPTRADRRTPIVEVFEHCRDAVVNISTTSLIRMRDFGGLPFDDIFNNVGPRWGDQRVQSVGSGVVIHESGYIVTNAHVVAQAVDVRVAFADQELLPADVLATDQEHDLAIIKVNAPRPFTAVKLGRSDDIMIGETVVAIGNPLGLKHSVTAGIVSALDRDLQFSRTVVYRGLIQTDAPINPGNSGGPLLNVNSELIGINSAIRGDAQNIGFAIPVDRLWDLLPALLDIERYQPVRFGLQIGGRDAEVAAVRADSPAARAGVQKGDRITKMNGHELHSTIDYCVTLLDQQPDSEVQLTVQRDGQPHELKVTLQSITPEDGAELAERMLGLTVRELPAPLRKRYRLQKDVAVLVDRVTRGGPADRAGIRPHDLILRLDRVTVTGLRGAGMTLERVQPGGQVLVEGLREDANEPFPWQATLRVAGDR